MILLVVSLAGGGEGKELSAATEISAFSVRSPDESVWATEARAGERGKANSNRKTAIQRIGESSAGFLIYVQIHCILAGT
jgi:hypothetical protein